MSKRRYFDVHVIVMTTMEKQAAGRVVSALRDGATLREVFTDCLGLPVIREDGTEVSEDDIRSVIFSILSRVSSFAPRLRREPIRDISMIIDLIRKATKIVAIIGAGASVGPDFRSPGGLYDTIAEAKVLEEPYQVFELDYFTRDPSVFWHFAHMIFPAVDPEHSVAHMFLANLENQGKLLRVYSQNVDTLEVGISPERLRCVHGSWRENKCMNCGAVYGLEDLRGAVEKREVPVCTKCQGQIKPGIVFFGQRTNIEDEDIQYDSDNADLLLVIGTSLRVAPVSYLPQFMGDIPAILINREPVTCQFNAELLGDCNDVCRMIENELGIVQDNEHTAGAFAFMPPNKFVMNNDSDIKFVETGRDAFFVNRTPPTDDEFE